MVIVMSPLATEAQIEAIVSRAHEEGLEAFVNRSTEQTVIVLVGAADVLNSMQLGRVPGVVRVVRVSTSYKLVSRGHHPERTTVRVRGVPIGPDTLTTIAGPCAVESPEQTLDSALLAIHAGATLLRGGAYKPRSSPYSFQGLGVEGLRILADVRDATGLPVVTEVIDAQDIDVMVEHADMLQVGARNMQNFALLRAVGTCGKPVMLKRGMNATVEEWLLAAEYIAQSGNLDIVLCERGIRTFEPATRNTLDISAVPIVQYFSHLPVIVDPSHSGGRRELVLPLSRAGVAAGADGLIVDVHANPEQALCDGPQALIAEDTEEFADTVERLAGVMGRKPLRHPLVRPVPERKTA